MVKYIIVKQMVKYIIIAIKIKIQNRSKKEGHRLPKIKLGFVEKIAASKSKAPSTSSEREKVR